ncbi:MAG: hypothetical protein JWO06_4023, partial [Bacteroidota bacterium]|nr:hypothetical protein [Bacteroidota bacterium]
MKNKFILLTAPAIICWCLFSLQACKQPLIGDKTLLNKNDSLNVAKDTLVLQVATLFEKPLITSGASQGLLGSLYDPNFGTTYCSLYAHFELTSSNISFGIGPVLDSAVFSLAYNGQYGLCKVPVDVSLYEMNQDMYDSLTYYSNTSFQVKTPPIGQLHSFVPDLIDSVPVQGGSLPAELRIRLTDAFGNRILHADSLNVLSSNQSFLSYFKGIYLTTNSNTVGNGLLALNLPSSLSGITLYYHNGDGIPLTYYIPISGAAVNHFDNIYTGTPAATAANSSAAQPKLYLQGGAGTKGKLTITNLATLPKNIGINKAEFIFSQTAGDTAYAAPFQLSLFRIDDAGNGQYLEDQGLSTFGGSLFTENINGVYINR